MKIRKRASHFTEILISGGPSAIGGEGLEKIEIDKQGKSQSKFVREGSIGKIYPKM